ncbi:MAG: hypothetical protein OHK0053_24220 [Microscillaceae bacterium]
MRQGILLAVLVFAFLAVQAQSPSRPLSDTTKIRFKQYVFKKFREDNQWVAGLYWQDSLLFRIQAPKASHLQYVAIDGLAFQDINQDNVPNFILQQYAPSETDYTCYWHIFALDRTQFRKEAEIQARQHIPWLADFDRDGIFEIVVKDYTFLHWNADFLQSPYELVPLRFQQGRYTPDLGLPRDSLPASLASQADSIRTALEQFYQESKKAYPYTVEVLGGSPEQRWGFVPSRLWAILLRLFYLGRGPEAPAFVEACWPAALEGREAFWDDFMARLRQSPFWDSLAALNQSLAED